MGRILNTLEDYLRVGMALVVSLPYTGCRLSEGSPDTTTRRFAVNKYTPEMGGTRLSDLVSEKIRKSPYFRKPGESGTPRIDKLIMEGENNSTVTYEFDTDALLRLVNPDSHPSMDTELQPGIPVNVPDFVDDLSDGRHEGPTDCILTLSGAYNGRRLTGKSVDVCGCGNEPCNGVSGQK